jgi:hypothetical protein
MAFDVNKFVSDYTKKSKGGFNVDEFLMKQGIVKNESLKTSDGLYTFAKSQGLNPPEPSKPLAALRRAGGILNVGTAFTSGAVKGALTPGKSALGEGLSSAKKSFTGEEITGFSDTARSLGVNPTTRLGKVGLATGGFVADVLFDPLTYLTFGVGAGLKVGEKALSKAGTELFQDVATQAAKTSSSKGARKAELLFEEALGKKGITEESIARLTAEGWDEATVRKVAQEAPSLVDKGGIKWAGNTLIGNDAIARSPLGKAAKIIGETELVKNFREAFGKTFVSDFAKNPKIVSIVDKGGLQIKRAVDGIIETNKELFKGLDDKQMATLFTTIWDQKVKVAQAGKEAITGAVEQGAKGKAITDAESLARQAAKTAQKAEKLEFTDPKLQEVADKLFERTSITDAAGKVIEQKPIVARWAELAGIPEDEAIKFYIPSKFKEFLEKRQEYVAQSGVSSPNKDFLKKFTGVTREDQIKDPFELFTRGQIEVATARIKTETARAVARELGIPLKELTEKEAKRLGYVKFSRDAIGTTAERTARKTAIESLQTLKKVLSKTTRELKTTKKGDRKLVSEINEITRQIDSLDERTAKKLSAFFSEGKPYRKETQEAFKVKTIPPELQRFEKEVKGGYGQSFDEWAKGQEGNILQHVSDNPNLTKFSSDIKGDYKIEFKKYQDKLKPLTDKLEKLRNEEDELRKARKSYNQGYFIKREQEIVKEIDKIKPPFLQENIGKRGFKGGDGIYLSSKPDFWRGAIEAEGMPMGEHTYDILVTNPAKAKEYMQTAGGGQMLPETLIQPNEGIVLGKSGEYDLNKKLKAEFNKGTGTYKPSVALELAYENGDLERAGFKSIKDFVEYVKNPYKKVPEKEIEKELTGDIRTAAQLQKRVTRLREKLDIRTDIDKTSMDDALSNLSKTIDDTKTSRKEIIDSGDAKKPAVEAWLPKDVAEEMNKFYQPKLSVIDDLAKATGFDYATGIFKGFVTSIFPSFHVRNITSNQFQNMLKIGVDVLNPAMQKDALSIVLGKNLDKVIVTKTGKRMTLGQIKDMVERESDILGTGAFGKVDQFIDEAKVGRSTLQKFNPLSRDNIAMQTGRKIGGTAEAQAKLVNILSNIMAGKSIKEGIKSAEEALFNYSKLTEFERSVMRRVIPFYTFARKNLELQLRTLATDPGKIATELKGIRSVGEAIGDPLTEEDIKGLPNYVLNSLGIKAGTDAYGRANFVTGLGLPIEEFFARLSGDKGILANAASNVLSQANPIFKFAGERATEQDFFRGRPIMEIDNGQDLKPFFDAMPKPVADKMKELVEFREIENQPVYVDGKVVGYQSKYTANPFALHFLRNLFTSRIQSTVGFLSSDDESNFNKALKFFTGVKSWSIDQEQQKYYNELERSRELQDFLIRMGLIKKFESIYKPKERNPYLE